MNPSKSNFNINHLALVIFVIAMCIGSAHAEDLYVSEAATSNGSGTSSKPYWRITDAVARARSDRQSAAIPASETITIHVAPGTYQGTYGSVGSNKQMEVLPITLNMPNIVLSGATTLALDGNGLPTGVAPGASQTLLITNDVFGPSSSQTLVAILRTTDGGAGDNVTVTGFTFDQPHHMDLPFPQDLYGEDIVVEHVSGFAIAGNIVRGATGVLSRFASGNVTGNLITANTGAGALISGGSLAYPSDVTIQGNRMVQNGELGLMACAGAPKWTVDLGHNNLTPTPNQPSGNHPENDVVGLAVRVIGNDLSQNFAFGLRLLFVPPFADDALSATGKAGVPLFTATVTGNWINGNGRYGVVVEGGDLNLVPNRFYSGTFAGAFARNQVLGNGINTALVTFAYQGGGSPYLQQALYNISDPEGELTGFDHDNPLTDPFYGTVLNNTLIVNGAVIPPGTKITP